MPSNNIRYVVRPRSVRGTPRRLARALRAETRVVNARNVYEFDPSRDLFLAIPPLPRVRLTSSGSEDSYRTLHNFYTRHKAGQRSLLQGYNIKTPADYEPFEGQYVHRPMRHMGGVDFNLSTESVAPDGQYSSPLFRKTREYRVLYCRGRRVCTYFKRVEERDPRVPWNHDITGATFMTVERDINDKLIGTSFYNDMALLMGSWHSSGFHYAGLIAVDVMYNRFDNSYAVCEFNFAPGITIDGTFERIHEICTEIYGGHN